MATINTSLSASRPPSIPPTGLLEDQTSRLAHPPTADSLASLASSQKQLCSVKPLTIKVQDDRSGPVRAFLHVPQNYGRDKVEGLQKTAAILLSGADGGVVGPSSMFPLIADKVASLNKGIPVMRIDYRYPANTKYCVPDVLAAIRYLETGYAVSRFVLVGWSFGGAPVSTVGGSDNRVVGCAMVASQLAETTGIRTMAPRPLLLMHGTGDKTMRYSCSEELYEDYGEGGEKELKLFEGDDHVLTKSSLEAEEMLCDFIMKCADVVVGDAEREVVQNELVADGDKVGLMKKWGDLKEEENVE